jgi:hypothetical protein
MSMRYQSAFSLGRRGWVTRTYDGPEAFIAILVDLALGLLFALVGFALRAAWSVAVLIVRIAWELAQIPLKAVRWTYDRYAFHPAPKPAWSAFDELG